MSSTPRQLANRILIGLCVGAVAGVLTLVLGSIWPSLLAGARKLSTWVFDPLGQIFLRMLFFVVIPLVFSSLATGVLQLGRLSRLGPLAGRTFALFFLNMAIAPPRPVMMNTSAGAASTTHPALMRSTAGGAETRRASEPAGCRREMSTCSCRATCSARSWVTSGTCSAKYCH
jgi:DAACS family dicarboxylate/amino acid:cation (Na+ or H+) symporter